MLGIVESNRVEVTHKLKDELLDIGNNNRNCISTWSESAQRVDNLNRVEGKLNSLT